MSLSRSIDRENPAIPAGLRHRSGITLIELLVVLLILGAIVALLIPARRTAGEAARRTQCKNNLKQIGIALYNYHDTYGEFPPAYTMDTDGRRLHSWRTLLLPFFDQKELYEKIDLSRPWDDPANAKAFQKSMPGFDCPSTTLLKTQTTYLAVVTSDSVIQASRSRSLNEITDHPSQTIQVLEVRPDQAVHWMSPHDADEKLLASVATDSKETHRGGRHALMADGAIKFVTQDTPAKTLQALYTATGGEDVGGF